MPLVWGKPNKPWLKRKAAPPSPARRDKLLITNAVSGAIIDPVIKNNKTTTDAMTIPKAIGVSDAMEEAKSI